MSRPRVPRATFDVFDTVLTRATGSPEAVFLLLGRKLVREGLVHCTPETFARARITAEERGHDNLGSWCRLKDIYREVAQGLSIDPSLIPALVRAECEVEVAVLRVVPAAAKRLAEARAAQGSIVYVSDTFFSSSFLRSCLEEHGVWQVGDHCYVSCEWGASKASGQLFDVVAREEGLRADDLVHMGNDAQADVRAARRRGWATAAFGEANLNRYERLLEASGYATEGLSCVLAGASRMARLSVAVQSEPEAALRDVTAGVVGSVLIGYVLWILHRARDMGLTRLYFLARDSQILLSIAKRLNDRLGLQLDLRYLYASRQAWNPAATFVGSERELAWIWDTTDTLTAEMVLSRASVSPETVAPELEAVGLPRSTWHRQLTEAERSTLAACLQSGAVKQHVLDAAAEQRDLLLHYFSQEGLLEDAPYGIVDLGWYGSMQKALAAVLSAAGRPAPTGFYFALHKGEIVDEAPLHREAYYFDERERVGYVDAVPNLIALMEMFCTADHGTTIGFEEHEGEVRPVLQEVANQPAIAWGLSLLRRTLDAFVDNLFLDRTYVDPYVDLRAPLTAVLTEFSRHPTRQEAAVWGSFPWEDGLGAATVRNSFAQPYHSRDLLKAIQVGSIRPQHRAAWIEGSLELSSEPVRAALRVAARFGRFRRALRARLAG